MFARLFLLTLSFSVLLACSTRATQEVFSDLGFVDIATYEKENSIPRALRIRLSIDYSGVNNFVGERIRGYYAKKCLLSTEAASALLKAQAALLEKGFSLLVFDCYRPQKAVNHFVEWSKDNGALENKADFYPDISPKSELFQQGYIASRSGHSRGSSVDVGLVETVREKVVDMGSRFDFFGTISHTSSDLITPVQRRNREILLSAMEKAGFRNYSKEWWHFTLENEPFPNTYFDFDVR